LFLGACALMTGCSDDAEPRDQWLVVVSTDAPVPQFGDRVTLDVIGPDGSICSRCSRQLGAANAGDWPIAFGVALPAGEVELRVRARLYRGATLGEAGELDTRAALDRVVRLAPASGIARVSLPLPMSCFGVPSDLELRTSCDPTTGVAGAELEAAPLATLTPLEPGSWSSATSVPCNSPAPEGMVCVPGGAFLLGDPQVADIVASTLPGSAPRPERLVRLSPFLLDRNELTVGEFRAVAKEHTLNGQPSQPGPNPGSELCSFLGVEIPDNDALPLNCVTRALAREVCGALGKRLPTEAEGEWAAGNLERETPFPWGHDPDVCSYAVVARDEFGWVTSCRYTDTGVLEPGFLPPNRPDVRDVTELGLVDLGGNLAEWVDDQFASYADTCWQQTPELLVDPLCSDPSITSTANRGGDWRSTPYSAHVALRHAVLATGATAQTGFRCAKSDG
jgi:formylglycine-generating enzyme required for sulfatase activity